jgi:hypothetical protein
MRPMTCHACSSDDLFKVYNELKRSYYLEGEALMGDVEFDRFENYLRERFPEDKRFFIVGYKG